MSPDLKTFVALQTSSVTLGTESEYIPRDDESEASRLVDPNGVGEINWLDEDDVRSYSMNDFGMDLRATDLMVPRVPKS